MLLRMYIPVTASNVLYFLMQALYLIYILTQSVNDLSSSHDLLAQITSWSLIFPTFFLFPDQWCGCTQQGTSHQIIWGSWIRYHSPAGQAPCHPGRCWANINHNCSNMFCVSTGNAMNYVLYCFAATHFHISVMSPTIYMTMSPCDCRDEIIPIESSEKKGEKTLAFLAVMMLRREPC